MSDTRVAFITGASSGLGAGLARHFARDGYAVAIAARREERLEKLATEIRDAGGEVLVCPLDVADRDAVRAAFEKTANELGEVDTLIANAGVTGYLPARKFEVDTLQRTMNINFYGVAHCIENVLPSMLERGRGHIVGVSSLAGFRGTPKLGPYNASKAALTSLLESLRIECRPRGVDVTVVCPGFVHTELTAKNNFPMPFALTEDEAVRRIYRAIGRKRRLYAFPWPLSAITRLGYAVPTWIWDTPLERVFK